MFTQSEENYLKAIFHLQQDEDGGVSTSHISELLNTKSASVTEMIKKLAKKDLVDYQKYYGVHLTETGTKYALKIIRKHRLWECFLVERLNFNWDEVHEVAEQLEHIKSDKLVDELNKILGEPKYDPHGDPIPDAEGNLPKTSNKKLSELHIDEQGVCEGFKDNSSAFLQFLAKQSIGLGTVIRVVEKEPFDDSMVILVDQKQVSLSKKAIENIFVSS